MTPAGDQDRCIIEFCDETDVPAVMAFIGRWWRTGHILASDRPLFDWQYRGAEPHRYNLVLAKGDGDIAGVLGFVPITRFDPGAKDSSLWLALWKVRPDIQTPGLGLRLRSFLVAARKPRLLACGGINKATFGLYTPFRYTVGAYQQYFIVNETMPDFKILATSAPLSTRSVPTAPSPSALAMVPSGELPALARDLTLHQPSDVYPCKSVAYFAGRYTNHPYYKYEIYTLAHDGRVQALFAMREVSHSGAKALRVVDFLGPEAALPILGKHAQQLLQERGGEYLDLLNYGIAKETFVEAGFRHLDPAGSTVVPQYFEPFERRNVEIYVALKLAQPGRCWMFKGDGDQDRPNLKGPQS